MSSKDKSLESGMGRRRPASVVQAEVAESIIGEMVPPTTLEVPLDVLYRSPFQCRAPASEEDLNSLAESMQAESLISPIVIRPVTNPNPDLHCKSSIGAAPLAQLEGRCYELITGHHRVQASLLLGWTVIPAVIKHLTDAQAARALAADNGVKTDLTDYDRYLTIQVLEQTGACKTGRELAATLGVSTAQISNLRAFGKLPANLIAIVDQSREAFGYRMIYEIANDETLLRHPALLQEAFASLVSGKVKQQNQVIPWVRQQIAKTSLAPRAPRRSYDFSAKGQDIKITVTDNKATIDASGLDCDKLAALIEANIGKLLR
ncbi:ParB/RepB/Spo0J family partition protein [Dechloromonas hortensis]|uniref:ParB/RepB/Spo0J family partition protein n=1 Tax=Dechloromonas hortensis TaxID=337779 RepID=UPI00129146E7|nr:ParB N-terminal domain-containing protein [Dechloromonas hortensis]